MKIKHVGLFDRVDAGKDDEQIQMVIEQDFDARDLRGPSLLIIKDVDGGPLLELHAEEVYEFLRGCNL